MQLDTVNNHNSFGSAVLTSACASDKQRMASRTPLRLYMGLHPLFFISGPSRCLLVDFDTSEGAKY